MSAPAPERAAPGERARRLVTRAGADAAQPVGRDERALSQPPMTLRGIALLAPSFERGGLGGQARLLARGLAQRGLPVTVVTAGEAERPSLRPETRGLVQVFRVPAGRGGAARLEAAALVLGWTRHRRLNAVVGFGPLAGAACRVGRALELPAVIKLTRDEVENRSGDAGAWRRAAAVAVADPHLAGLAARAGLSRGRTVMIPDAVDAGRFTPRARSEEGPPRVAFVGALEARKRLEVLLAAVARLDLPAELAPEVVLVGDGPARAELAAEARRLGLAARVRFLGRDAEPLEVLREAQVFVLPATRQGASTALLEALAAGCPAIAAERPGLRALFSEQELVFAPLADPAALARALGRVLGDADLRSRLGAAGRAAAERHALDAVAERWVERLAAVGVPRDADGLPAPAPPTLPLLRGAAGACWRLLRGARRSHS